MTTPQRIDVQVNGKRIVREVEPRLTLADFLRHELGLTGTHVGCEHGVCGSCTILFDGKPVRSCLMFAIQAQGHEILTVESLGTPEHLHPFLADNPQPTEAEIREAISGNLCRCTGYQHIVEAVHLAASQMAQT